MENRKRYQTGFSDAESFEVALSDFGYERCVPLHSFGPHVRKVWLIHYVKSGRGIFVKKGQIHHLKAGEAFVIAPFEETFYQADELNPWEYIWISFYADSHSPLPFSRDTAILRSQNISEIFSAMKKSEELSGGQHAYLTGLLWQLFSDLSQSGDEVREDYIDKAKNLIEAEYMHELTVEGIARRLNLERSYFSTLFKRRVGIAPKEYIVNVRLKTAAELMAEHGCSPTVAAASTGYDDISSFSKMFKKKYGVSPREYIRKNARRDIFVL